MSVRKRTSSWLRVKMLGTATIIRSACRATGLPLFSQRRKLRRRGRPKVFPGQERGFDRAFCRLAHSFSVQSGAGGPISGAVRLGSAHPRGGLSCVGLVLPRSSSTSLSTVVHKCAADRRAPGAIGDHAPPARSEGCLGWVPSQDDDDHPGSDLCGRSRPIERGPSLVLDRVLDAADDVPHLAHDLIEAATPATTRAVRATRHPSGEKRRNQPGFHRPPRSDALRPVSKGTGGGRAKLQPMARDRASRRSGPRSGAAPPKTALR